MNTPLPTQEVPFPGSAAAAVWLLFEFVVARPQPACAKKTPLKGLRFESLEEAQAYLDRWEER